MKQPANYHRGSDRFPLRSDEEGLILYVSLCLLTCWWTDPKQQQLAGLLNWLRHRIRLVVPIVAILLVASGCGAFFALKDRYSECAPPPFADP